VTPKTELIFLIGATAVGKSAVATELARRIGGEIVSADSMQVYRGLDILSAKPSPAERRSIPHHLIDVACPFDRFDVAAYVRLAGEAVAGILSRGRMPIVVGGSGMYVRALLDGIFTGPGRDAALRDRLEKQAAEEGLAALYGRLKKLDPEAAGRIHPNDKKRIVRALEVYELTGRRVSSLQTEWRGSPSPPGDGVFFSAALGRRTSLFGLRRGREDVKRRIDERVEQMFSLGAVKEIEDILRMKIEPDGTIVQALGFGEIRGYLDGRCSLAEAKEMLKKNTRAYAKRQHTWFKRDARIRWFDLAPAEPETETAERILQSL
jgi:tRNA dimethylallyltransferase